jgi:septal ring factor EnvC (AmiA/AmiB activator)
VRTVLFSIVMLLAFSAGGDDQSDELARLRAELAAKRAEIGRLSSQERDEVSRLSALDEQLTLSRRLLHKLDVERSHLHREVDSLVVEEDTASTRLVRKQAILEQRIRHMYRMGRYRGLRVLLGLRSLSDLLRRTRFLLTTAGQDRRLLRSVRQQRDALGELRTNQERRLHDVAMLTEEARVERDRRRGEAEEHGRLLGDIRNKKKLYEQAIAELEATAARIEGMLSERNARRAEQAGLADRGGRPRTSLPEPLVGSNGPFATRKGRLPWPVRGRITSTFGRVVHPRFHTTTFNHGIDIRVQQRTPVSAVNDGVVAYTGWMPGYGMFVIIEHDSGYYTLYAHLEGVSVSEGSVVAEGSVVGVSGESGSLDGPKLHFEVREGRRAIDPVAWLSRG